MGEYTRTAVIAHISQATTGTQEGWGRPGTKWENTHFRTFILDSLPAVQSALTPASTLQPGGHKSALSSHPPLSMQPLLDAAHRIGDQGVVLLVNSYANLIEKARFSRREPDEADAMAVERVLNVVTFTMELKRKRVETADRPG